VSKGCFAPARKSKAKWHQTGSMHTLLLVITRERSCPKQRSKRFDPRNTIRLLCTRHVYSFRQSQSRATFKVCPVLSGIRFGIASAGLTNMFRRSTCVSKVKECGQFGSAAEYLYFHVGQSEQQVAGKASESSFNATKNLENMDKQEAFG
jgi:hypothetical protein